MEFPEELWQDQGDARLARDLLVLFASTPVMLTDNLANSIYLSKGAERILGGRAEALVNRLSFSLLGFGTRNCVPAGLEEALLGEGPPWRGVAPIDDGAPRFIEASAVARPGRFICGVVRFSAEEAET